MAEWEVVIGLEVHAQLNTKTKLFSSAPNHFGDEPNTNISIVDTGQPGALPVLNKKAVFKAILLGLALEAQVCKFSKFDRKSYFYPDSPRNFQITQLDYPIIKGGKITADIDGELKTFEIDRAHLEDDAGMLKHFSSFSGVDYNRAGVPLIEIVSKPCLSSPKEAIAYVKALKAILEYIDVSDCDMEKGSLRIDVNVSVKKRNEKKLRNKVEIKNMNSFHFLELALISEIERQIQLYEKYPDEDPNNVILSGTFRYDVEKNKTVMMRMKERAEDYRYFPEPDLTPIILTDEYIDSVRKTLPELPQDRFKRYVSELNLSKYSASVLITEKKISDYFEHCLLICNNAKGLCNWITVEFPGRLKELGHTVYSSGIPANHIATLVNLIDEKKITGRIAKQVADDMIKNPGINPIEIVQKNPNYQPLSDSLEIEPIVKKVLNENPQSIEDYKQGKKKALSFLVGQVMKQTKGKASPEIVNELILKNIDSNQN
jgi:aspartyl-tRNA(Asn)/glutamyl-tRNA(Gln) amidotransferase subunit B